MAPVQDAREKLVRLLAERPNLTTDDLVLLAGVTRQRVHKILKELGYEVRCVWMKRGGKR